MSKSLNRRSGVACLALAVCGNAWCGASRTTRLASAPPERAPASAYDVATGLLTLLQLKSLGSDTCQDMVLRTVSKVPIRVELTTAKASTCADAATIVAIYDAASQSLSVPQLNFVNGGCFDTSWRTVQTSPIQFEMTAISEAACGSASTAHPNGGRRKLIER